MRLQVLVSTLYYTVAIFGKEPFENGRMNQNVEYQDVWGGGRRREKEQDLEGKCHLSSILLLDSSGTLVHLVAE